MTSVFTEQLFHSIFLPNPDISKKRNEVTSKSVKVDTDIVTCDVIDVFVRKNVATLPRNKVCEAVRWIIKELMARSNDSVIKLIEQLTLKDVPDDECNVIFQVLDTVFADKQINWGRVGVTYVFGLRLAEQYKKNKMGDRSEQIIHTIGDYIAQNLTCWIIQQGGWESIRHHFSDEKELITKMKSACVVLLTFGVGALTSMFT